MVYDIIYKDKDYEAEAEYVSVVLQKYYPNCCNILELGCGTGSHGIYLSSGYNINGIDKNKEFIKEAKKKGYKCKVADMTEYKSKKKYDAVISLFHAMSYITLNKDLIKVFKNTYDNLREDGIFMFDAWYTPAVYTQKPQSRIKHIDNIIRLTTPSVSYNTNVVTIHHAYLIDGTRGYEDIHMRHFSIPEIEFIAEMTGFKLLKSEEFLTTKGPSEYTWAINYILQKNGTI